MRRRNQKLLVTFRAGDGTFGEPEDRPAGKIVHPFANTFADLIMQCRIPYDAALAHPIRANLELRLDQCDEDGVVGGAFKRGQQDGLQANETGVTDDKIDGLRHLVARQLNALPDDDSAQ